MKTRNYFLMVGVIALLSTGCQNQSQDDALQGVIINEETNEVSLATTTDEAVQLEFKFTKGNKVENLIEMEMEMEMMGQKMPITVNIEGKYEVKDIDDQGNADIEYAMTRMQMNSEAQGVKFDSNEKPEQINPEMAPILKILNKNVISKISPKGKTLGIDYSQLSNELGEEYAMLKANLEQNINQFNQSSFVVLPEGAVKVGDTFEADAIEQNYQGLPMKIQTSYKVKSISEDKSKVILEPDGTIELGVANLPDGVSIKMNQGKMSGWILLDLNRGMVLRSNMITLMDISSMQMGQQMDMIIRMNMTMTTK